MLDVLITVDTEVWPVATAWPHTPLAPGQDASREIDAYLEGGDARAPGVAWQLEKLRDAGLKATYFIDPLFSLALGIAPLARVVRRVEDSGQETGLHLHPEWLTDPRCAGLPAFRGPYLGDYAEDDQSALIAAGLQRLREAGAGEITAFRAGSWGANVATLRALARHGIAFDSSLNASFAASLPDLPGRGQRDAPFRAEGLWVVPVTRFVDRPPAGRRPLHVCACSFAEMRVVLEHAYQTRSRAVVIVLHSFEFLRVDRLAGGGRAGPQRLLMRRFERLCEFLSMHADRFATRHFRDLRWEDAGSALSPPLVSTRGRTLARVVEQLASRAW